MAVALSAAAFPGIGCAASSATQRIDDPARMGRLILQAVPVGSDIAEAERFMKSQGFTCEQERNAEFKGRKGLDYLYCYRTEGSIVLRRWEIAIVDCEGKVSEVLAKTVLTGP